MTAARAFIGVVLVALAVGLPTVNAVGGPGPVRLVPLAAAFAGVVGIHRRIEARSRLVLASVGSFLLLLWPFAVAVYAVWALLPGPFLLLAAGVLPTRAGAPRGADLSALVPVTVLFAAVVCGAAMSLA